MFHSQMSDDIRSIPLIPDGLREAAQKGTLIFLMTTSVNLICFTARYRISDVGLGGPSSPNHCLYFL